MSAGGLDPTTASDGSINWSEYAAVASQSYQIEALNMHLVAFNNVDWATFTSVSPVIQQASALQNHNSRFNGDTLPTIEGQNVITNAASVDINSTPLLSPANANPNDIAAVLYSGYYSILPKAADPEILSFGGSDAAAFLSALKATGKTTGTISIPIALAVPVNNVLPAPPASGSYYVTVDKTVNATYTYVGSEDILVVAGGVETFYSSISGVNPVVLTRGAKYIFTPISGQSVALTVNYVGSNLSTVNPPPPCFLYDAPVLTPSGYRAIGDLRVDDIVMSLRGPMAIKAIKKELAAPNDRSYPYVIPEGLYGATQRLLISPHHQVLLSPSDYKEARFLNLEREVMSAPWDYYNVELVDNTADMIVAGVVVETWKLWDRVKRLP